MGKVIISVIGSGLHEREIGKITEYKINDNTYKAKCKLSVLPILTVEKGEKTLLFIVPHSLEYKKQTKKFVESITNKLLKCNSKKAGFNYNFIKENNNLKLKIGEETCYVYIQPVQVRGKIGYYKFNGDPRTAFTATYYALTQIGGNGNIDEIIIDTTHGWNHILLLTALGAQAYAKISNAKIRYYTTEPTASPGGGTAISRTPNIFEIKGVHTILKLIDAISNFQSFSIRGFTLEDQQEIINILREDIPCADQEIIVEFRRLLCGLSTAMIPYIHMKLQYLICKKNVINCYIIILKEKIGKIVDNTVIGTDINYEINTSLLSYIVLHSINHILSELTAKISEQNLGTSGQLSREFIEGLHEYYNDKWPLMASIMEHELNIIFNHNIHCNDNNPKGVASRVLCGENGFFDNPKRYVNFVEKIRNMLNNKYTLTNDDIKRIMRNLYAHLGLQNYTIKSSCIESCGNAEYVEELFKKLEQLPDRPNSSICDLSIENSEGQ